MGEVKVVQISQSVSRCEIDGCHRLMRRPSKRCVRHGGGRRCIAKECVKGAVHPTHMCIAHGGGRRCEMLGCVKSAQSVALGMANLCIMHGGRPSSAESPDLRSFKGSRVLQGHRRACGEKLGALQTQKNPECTMRILATSVNPKTRSSTHDGPFKSRQSGTLCEIKGCKRRNRRPSKCCVKHGGGRRCTAVLCTKGAVYPTTMCVAHGGGKRNKASGARPTHGKGGDKNVSEPIGVFEWMAVQDEGTACGDVRENLLVDQPVSSHSAKGMGKNSAINLMGGVTKRSATLLTGEEDALWRACMEEDLMFLPTTLDDLINCDQSSWLDC